MALRATTRARYPLLRSAWLRRLHTVASSRWRWIGDSVACIPNSCGYQRATVARKGKRCYYAATIRHHCANLLRIRTGCQYAVLAEIVFIL